MDNKLKPDVFDKTYVSPKFLFQAKWWQNAFHEIQPAIPRMIAPAIMLAISNLCGNYVWIASSAASLELNPNQLTSALGSLVNLLICSVIGVVFALIAFSWWLFELTIISRHHLHEGRKTFKDCVSDIHSHKGHIAAAWSWAILWMLLPTVALSVGGLFWYLPHAHVNYLGIELFSLPAVVEFPLACIVCLLASQMFAYTYVLTVLSSEIELKASKSAALSFHIIFRYIGETTLLNLFAILLVTAITTPSTWLELIPPMLPVIKNFTVCIMLQLWFAVSSIICYPLSIMIFAEFLRSLTLRASDGKLTEDATQV